MIAFCLAVATIMVSAGQAWWYVYVLRSSFDYVREPDWAADAFEHSMTLNLIMGIAPWIVAVCILAISPHSHIVQIATAITPAMLGFLVALSFFSVGGSGGLSLTIALSYAIPGVVAYSAILIVWEYFSTRGRSKA